MKRQLMIAAAACLTLAAGTASADCAAEVAALGQGVVKDGSTAPLGALATPQTGGDAAATATPPASVEGAGEVAKDGSTAPLGADPALATSAADAQAQSEGGATAAEQAQGALAGPADQDEGTMRAEALVRAQAALDAGNEAACLEAVEAAKGV